MTTQPLRVGVIFGGRSGEHEVSLASARAVIQTLSASGHTVMPIAISKSGRWLSGPKALSTLQRGSDILQSTDLITPDGTGMLTSLEQHGKLTKLDVVFPVLHGSYGEDGTMQGLLELADIPYVGSGVLGSAVAMDKVIQKQICQQVGIPVVRYTSVTSKEYTHDQTHINERLAELRYPLFVKPANLGSSVGITKVHGAGELTTALRLAFTYDTKVIIEEGVVDAHEIEVAMLGNETAEASVPGEIISSNEFYDYDAKYVDGASTEKIPAPLPEPILSNIQDYAKQAFSACNCSGMARIDFLVDQAHTIYLNEINTIPGFTSISMYSKLWHASGIAYPDLLDRLLRLAIERHASRRSLKTSYSPKSNWYQ